MMLWVVFALVVSLLISFGLVEWTVHHYGGA
jgi:hypothetical protein